MTKKIKISLITVLAIILMCSTLCFSNYFASADNTLESAVQSTNVYMVKGASLRYGTTEDEMGFRYTLLIKKANYESLGNDVSYGMFFLPKDYVDIHPLDTDLSYYYWDNGNGEYVDEQDNVLSEAQTQGKAYVVNFSNVSLLKEDLFTANEMMSFNGSLIGIKDGSDWKNCNLDRQFVGVGYIKYQNSEGNIAYKFANKLYSETNGVATEEEFTYSNNSRSMVYVAQKAVEANFNKINTLKTELEVATGDEKIQLEEKIATIATDINMLNSGYIGKLTGYYNKVLADGEVSAEKTEVLREKLDQDGNPTGEFEAYKPLTIDYTVEYYVLNGNEYNLMNSEVKSGTINDTVEIEIPEIGGFELDLSANNVLSGVLYSNNELVLKAYFKAKPFELDMNASRVEERCSNGQAPDVGDWDEETNVTVGGETALYNFYNVTNDMGWGDTTMYAYLRYTYTQNDVAKKISDGMNFVKFEVYFGIYNMRNSGAVAPETLDVALTDNDGTRASYATNKWIEVYIPIDDFNTIVGNGGYTFKLYPVTSPQENTSGTYSIAIKSISFVEAEPVKPFELDMNASRVEERCSNGQAPDVGDWDEETNVTVGGETALYNFYNVTNDMGWGDTTMYAYLRYTYTQNDVAKKISDGMNFVKFEVYFGIYNMRNSGAVAPETLDVALTDNDGTRASYATNKWIEVYIPIDDFNTIVGNGGYTFKLYPVTSPQENTSGTYSIAIKSISFVEEKPELPLPEVKIGADSFVLEMCSNPSAPDTGYWDKDISLQEFKGKTAQAYFVNESRDMEWGDAYMDCKLIYNITTSDIDVLMREGYTKVTYEVYFGIENTVAELTTLSVATMGVKENATNLTVNEWITVSLNLEDLKTVIANNDWTFHLDPIDKGDASTCGTYSLAVGEISFAK